MVHSNGTCVTCPAGTSPDRNGRECLVNVRPPPPPDPMCRSAQEVYSADGRRCVACPNYTVADRNNRYCITDNCGSPDLYISSAGVCTRCPVGYLADSTNRSCIPDRSSYRTSGYNCNGDREVYNEDASKCLRCQAYTRAQDFNSRCGADSCGSNEVVTP